MTASPAMSFISAIVGGEKGADSSNVIMRLISDSCCGEKRISCDCKRTKALVQQDEFFFFDYRVQQRKRDSQATAQLRPRHAPAAMDSRCDNWRVRALAARTAAAMNRMTRHPAPLLRAPALCPAPLAARMPIRPRQVRDSRQAPPARPVRAPLPPRQAVRRAIPCSHVSSSAMISGCMRLWRLPGCALTMMPPPMVSAGDGTRRMKRSPRDRGSGSRNRSCSQPLSLAASVSASSSRSFASDSAAPQKTLTSALCARGRLMSPEQGYVRVRQQSRLQLARSAPGHARAGSRR